MSRYLAESALARGFCGLEKLGDTEVRVPGKSRINEYERWIGERKMKEINEELVRKSQEEDERGGSVLGLKCSVELDMIWVDSTCLEANIHHPVDWVLLVDANRTLLKVIEVIRRQGLRSRMAPPKSLMKEGNLLSMEMTQEGRRQGGGLFYSDDWQNLKSFSIFTK
jgi:hypothetical protein